MKSSSDGFCSEEDRTQIPMRIGRFRRHVWDHERRACYFFFILKGRGECKLVNGKYRIRRRIPDNAQPYARTHKAAHGRPTRQTGGLEITYSHTGATTRLVLPSARPTPRDCDCKGSIHPSFLVPFSEWSARTQSQTRAHNHKHARIHPLYTFTHTGATDEHTLSNILARPSGAKFGG